MILLINIVILLVGLASVSALDNGLARTPQMGYYSSPLLPVSLLYPPLFCFSSLSSPSLSSSSLLILQYSWNSWNHFHCTINETLIRNTAYSIATSPLKEAGYIYVNMDGMYSRERDAGRKKSDQGRERGG